MYGNTLPLLTPGPSRREILLNPWDYVEIHNSIIHGYPNSSEEDFTEINQVLNDLEHSRCLPASEIPKDIVTLNSVVTIRNFNCGTVKNIILVLPGAAGMDRNCVSVLHPLGRMLLGSRVKEMLEFQEQGCPVRYQVEQILYQPESMGEYQAKSLSKAKFIVEQLHR